MAPKVSLDFLAFLVGEFDHVAMIVLAQWFHELDMMIAKNKTTCKCENGAFFAGRFNWEGEFVMITLVTLGICKIVCHGDIGNV